MLSRQSQPAPTLHLHAGKGASNTIPSRPTNQSTAGQARHPPSQPTDIDRRHQAQAGAEGGAVHEDERPSKRARISSELVDTPTAYTEYRIDEPTHEHVEAVAFPARPRRLQQSRRDRKTLADLSARRAVGLTPPPLATHLTSTTRADFYPWAGQSPEDVINDAVIKNGHSDKGVITTQSESASARGQIWPTLQQKNQLALHTLSHLFTQVLDRRQQAGSITAPSTFKPPPRVTVTDTKREAWLRDLANPSIPLKRQSRTIPHGVRGKLLLEQCLLKNVPIPRALWLAKCVGANELRAFRRKGVTGPATIQGELSWIKDWTASVTQFLDDNMHPKMDAAWRKRLKYTVGLVTAIACDDLLDHDQFLNHLVNSIDAVSIDLLPLWLLPARIFWKRLTTTLDKRGRRLALIILRHLKSFADGNSSVNSVLMIKLQSLVSELAMDMPSCLVIPAEWTTYKAIIEACLDTTPGTSPIFERLKAWNEQLSVPSLATKQVLQGSLAPLYRILDTVSIEDKIEDVSAQCRSVVPDTDELVAAVLDWSTTCFRTGFARITLAQALLSNLVQVGCDIQAAIVSFLTHIDDGTSHSHAGILNIISYLIDKGRFSSGHYLQWLIASGALSGKNRDICMDILEAMPIAQLSQNLLNTRSALLDRDGRNTIAATIVLTYVDDLFSKQACQLDDIALRAVKSLSAVSAIRVWVRSKVSLTKNTAITYNLFSYLRHVLEMIHDIDGMQALLEVAATTDDFRILGYAADVINAHKLELSMIGQLEPLVVAVFEQYRVLRRQQPLERSSLYALANLIRDAACGTTRLQHVQADIASHGQHSITTACSPASDNLIGMQAGELESEAEIEAVFATGNTMDEFLMRRLFARVMQWAEAPNTAKLDGEASATCRWLGQLRSLDRATFDKLVKEYTNQTAKTISTDSNVRGIHALLAADCLGGTTLAQACDIELDAKAALETLLLLNLPADISLSVAEHYHLEQQLSQFRLQHTGLVARLLEKCIGCVGFPQSAAMTRLAVRLQTADAGIWTKLARASLNQPAARKNLQKLCRSVLFPEPDLHGCPHEINEIIAVAEELNLPVVVALVACDSNYPGIHTALLACIEAQSPVWPHILQAAPGEVVRMMHDWAFEQAIKNGGIEAERATLCGSILDITFGMLPPSDHAAALSTLALRLRCTGKLMGDGSGSWTADNGGPSLRLLVQIVLVIMQRASKSEASVQASMHTVLAMAVILAQDTLQQDKHLLQLVHDATSQVIDQMPDEARPRLLRSLANAGIRHSSFKTLLGGDAAASEWLALSNTAAHAGARTLARQRQAGLRATLTTAQAGQAPSSQQGKAAMQPARQMTQAEGSTVYSAYTDPRRWEMMQDPTPVMGENDSAISLSLFGARRA